MRSLLLLIALSTACLAMVIPPARDNVVECLMCEKAVRAAAPNLGKDTETIEKDFDEDCVKDLKIPLAGKECEKYINKNLDPIIKELESGTAPKDVCTKLHEC
ncbi:Surfactant protein B [Trichostrongylus colubriformis]|uniref:Surfactant protein B n=1 Tax=Trichostrongylus colubriformis TaxID=6319 RepID=A0AAN8FQ81_TRICO